MSHRAELIKMSMAYESHCSYTYGYLAMCKNGKCNVKQCYHRQTTKAQEDLMAVCTCDLPGKTGKLVFACLFCDIAATNNVNDSLLDSKYSIMFP